MSWTYTTIMTRLPRGYRRIDRFEDVDCRRGAAHGTGDEAGRIVDAQAGFNPGIELIVGRAVRHQHTRRAPVLCRNASFGIAFWKKKDYIHIKP